MSADVHNMQKEVKKYLAVYVALLILTVVTVWISGWQVGVGLGVVLGLLVATTKASLVAAFFMHLIEKNRSIYIVLGLTMFFMLAMLILISMSRDQVPEGTTYVIENSSPDIHHH